MLFREQLRSLTPAQRDRFRQFNGNERRAIRGYTNISGDTLAPFVNPSVAVFGVAAQETYGLVAGPDDISFERTFLSDSAFSEFGWFDFRFISRTDLGDTFRFSPDFEYEVVHESGDRRGYLIYQLDGQGRGQSPRNLLAVVGGKNPKLRSLSQADQPLSAANFLS